VPRGRFGMLIMAAFIVASTAAAMACTLAMAVRGMP
jgi:hypothetical protein